MTDLQMTEYYTAECWTPEHQMTECWIEHQTTGHQNTDIKNTQNPTQKIWPNIVQLNDKKTECQN